MNQDKIGGCIIKETLLAIENATSLIGSVLVVDRMVRRKANAFKIDGMINVRGNSFVFYAFQDRNRMLKVSGVQMKTFFDLVESINLGHFEKITDNAEKIKKFIAGILAGESVLIIIDKKILEMCKMIIRSCGVPCKINFDCCLKVHRSRYWSNLCQYVYRFSDNEAKLSCVKDFLFKSNTWTRSVCCKRICESFINNNDSDGFCTECEQNLNFHENSDVSMQLNYGIKITLFLADSSKIYITYYVYHELLYFYFL